MDATMGSGSARAAEGIARRGKTSESVVAYLLEGLYEGWLRSRERVDIDQIAEKLGISRSPVREALVILERDGIVATRYHQGVYVERFNAESIVENFEIYGTLSGLACARLARDPDQDVMAEMRRLLGELRATPADQPDRLATGVGDRAAPAPGRRLAPAAGGTAHLRRPWAVGVPGGRRAQRRADGRRPVARDRRDRGGRSR